MKSSRASGNYLPRLHEAAERVSNRYYRLVVVLNAEEKHKKALIQEILRDSSEVYYINLNLEVSQALLDVPVHRLPLKFHDAVEAVIDEKVASLLFLGNFELLFDPALQCNVLDLLKHLSRNRTILVMWPGRLQAGRLVFAYPGHPEYRDWAANGLEILEI